ncbi:hypothetical protein [Escherichia phage P817]|nr:hypothetical protein [Escherichia phage P817]
MGMFDFNEDKLTDEQIMEIATEDGLEPLRVAINANGYRQSQKYWCEVEVMRRANLNREQCVVVEKIWKQATNGKGVVGVRSTYEAIRKVQPFVERNGVMNNLIDNILPSLQDAGIICLIGDKIYAHPYLVGMYGRDIHKWCDPWRSVERKSHSKLQASSDMIHGYDADEVRKAVEFYRKAKSLLNGE